MKIDTSKLPINLDTLRQEVIKQEGERIVLKKLSKVSTINVLLILIESILIAIHESTMSISTIIHPFIIMSIAVIIMSILALGASGKLYKYYHKKLCSRNYGLSKEGVDQKMIEYMEDMLDKMNEEMSDLDKKKEKIIKEDKETSAAYYQVYLSYNNLIAKIDPQHFSCMEGGDRY
jgi:5-bromo-4-chloroindolyl phosphate hydrolysis protein